jgi:hypothetical protein
VVEIVDTEAQIDRFLPLLDGMITSGLVTLEKVRAIHYRSAKGRSAERESRFRRA